MGKGKEKGKAKGPPKPEGMSDEEWSLFNNVAELVMNLRGPSPLNTVQCLTTKGQAGFYLWTHATSSQAKMDEIISSGAIPQAIVALKTVEPHERPAIAGLIHCFSAVNSDSVRDQLSSIKPVYPNPSIPLLPMLFDHLGSHSTATEVSCMGTLCNLAEHLETRPLIVKEFMRDPQRLVHVMVQSPSAQARAQAALCLMRLCMVIPEQARNAELVRTTLIQSKCLEECVEAMRHRCVECTSAKREWAVPFLEHVTGLLQRLLPSEAAKAQVVAAGGIQAFSDIISPTTRLPSQLTLQCAGHVAACLALLTIPNGFKFDLLDELSQEAKLEIPGKDLSGGGDDDDVDDDDYSPPATLRRTEEEEDNDDDLGLGGVDSGPGGDDGGALEQLAPSMTDEQRSQRKAHIDRIAAELESNVERVSEAGAIASLVLLLKGPEVEEGGGKKKKKEPPLPPGMAECQMYASQCLRHVALFEKHRRVLRTAGAIQYLTKLTESKMRETRMHAQGTLMSLGVDDGSIPEMQHYQVPEYIMMLSNLNMLEAAREANRAAAEEENAK